MVGGDGWTEEDVPSEASRVGERKEKQRSRVGNEEDACIWDRLVRRGPPPQTRGLAGNRLCVSPRSR